MQDRDCLPENLRGPTTTITRMAAGLSGAGVYRVDSGDQSFVLKIAGESERDEDWRSALQIQRLAAGAGLAPRVVHVDEGRRAVLSAFVADRSFPAFYVNPGTRQEALRLLGAAVRRIHALPIPAGAPAHDPRQFLGRIWGGLRVDFSLPDFAVGAVERVLAETPPPSERSSVLCHNDLNPSNLVFDGEALLILDWATAGPMEALYDLAVLAMFLRMDEGTCLGLLSAYEGTRPLGLPDRFLYARRLAAGLAGTMQLLLARHMKHPGSTAADTLEAALPLGDFYQRMRAGVLTLGTPEGQWAFGLALLKESLAL